MILRFERFVTLDNLKNLEFLIADLTVSNSS